VEYGLERVVRKNKSIIIVLSAALEVSEAGYIDQMSNEVNRLSGIQVINNREQEHRSIKRLN
jgi:hypothetical protein